MNSILEIERAAPKPFSFSAPFWEATRDKKILLQFCTITEKPQFYPRPTSIFTGRRSLEWREVSGEGEVYTYTVAYRGVGPFRGLEPYVIVTVELDAGVRIIGNLVNCETEKLAIGMRVRPYWASLTDGKHQLMFEPDHRDN